jgi:ComF family protein
LQRLIGDFKFERVYAAQYVLADLLLAHLDQLPPETVVTPVPTAASHIRQRGYDHTLLLARRVAKERGLKLAQPLIRATATKQRDANRAVRLAQAKTAFTARHPVDAVPYLLIDDVVTTGATMYYAAKLLKDAGAREVWAATIARQPLD